VKRAILFCAALGLFAVTHSRAATGKAQLEIWGVAPGDSVSIDGVEHAPKGGGAPRTFTGDDAATNAPIAVELATGKHEISVRRGECAPRSFTVDVEGAAKHAVVLEKEDESRCAIPLLPPRR
jgi:protein involved in polysaccharide export with SLBB domain